MRLAGAVTRAFIVPLIWKAPRVIANVYEVAPGPAAFFVFDDISRANDRTVRIVWVVAVFAEY
jgi:hypothetical protein